MTAKPKKPLKRGWSQERLWWQEQAKADLRRHRELQGLDRPRADREAKP
jgi:hypothetical protein